MLNLRQYDELRRASPFRPFRIVMSDGAKFNVPHPEFTWRMPNGGLIFVATLTGNMNSPNPPRSTVLPPSAEGLQANPKRGLQNSELE